MILFYYYDYFLNTICLLENCPVEKLFLLCLFRLIYIRLPLGTPRVPEILKYFNILRRPKISRKVTMLLDLHIYKHLQMLQKVRVIQQFEIFYSIGTIVI